MSRPSAIYLLTIAMLVIGLWAIMRIGTHLRAPVELAGKWEMVADGDREGAKQMVMVEQSGKFVRVVMAGGEEIKLAISQARPDADKGGWVAMGEGAGVEVPAGGRGGQSRFLLGGRWYVGRLQGGVLAGVGGRR